MKQKKWKTYAVGLGLMFPSLLIYTVLFAIPILSTIKLSFNEWEGIQMVPQKFVGLSNYTMMFTNENFWRSVYNSFVFMVVTVCVIMPMAFFLAYVIFKGVKASGFFKTVFYIPTILPMAATGLMWSIMLYFDGGVVNELLKLIGIHGPDWLGNPTLAIWTVCLVNAWIYIGQNMLVFLAGMTGISNDILEAAEIDGAIGIKKLWYIIVPNVVQSFKIFLVTGIAGCLKVFAIVYVMTGGGPGNATDVPATLLYDYSYIYSKFGYGAAIGIFITVSALIVSGILNIIFDKLDQTA